MPEEEARRKTKRLVEDLSADVREYLIRLLELEREYLSQESALQKEIRDRAQALLREIVK